MLRNELTEFSVIQNIFKLCFKPPESSSIRTIKNRIKKKIFKPYIFSKENEVIGFTILKHYQNGIHIEYLGINPIQQGKGFGRQILDMYDCGITLECKHSLLPFYKKMGFKELGCFNHYHFMYKNMTTHNAKTMMLENIISNIISEIISKETRKGEQEELVEYEKNKVYYIFLFRDITKT